MQSPWEGQNWNPYAYVLNNPLSFTDPSGYSFFRKYWRQIVAVVVSYVSYGAASSWASGWAASATVQGAVSGAVSGLVGGAVASGSVKGGVQGAFSGAVLGGIGGHYGGRVTVGRVAASGLAGGVLADLQGGKFGHGFLSAGVAAASGPYVPQDDVVAGATVSAILGGSVSALTGGKFANGAVTGAFSYAFGRIARRKAPEADGTLTLEEAKNSGWPTADEARVRLWYARFSLTWLHQRNLLPSEYDFAFEPEAKGFLDFNYNDYFLESSRYPGRIELANAPLDGNPIQFYRGGVSFSDPGTFKIYAHEVLHRNPAFSARYLNNPASIDLIHADMMPIVNAARSAYVLHQSEIDVAWERQ
ncbi:MAG: hypothetical protein KatS3mg126_0010 [Lysobacteraceae bacterium]|nr:MAG: hypothetical protein KatS3mg126_0010 [Xanthomonadaceae bacterium]